MIPENCYQKHQSISVGNADMNSLSTSSLSIGDVTSVDRITATSAFENLKTRFYHMANEVNVRTSTLIASGIHYVVYYKKRTIPLSFYL